LSLDGGTDVREALKTHDGRRTLGYEKPLITDHGDLAAVTAGCIGTDAPDLLNPTDPEGFPDNSPAFGDPSFCE
jgi:hypothetical protein